jgi:hypothetical protein
MAWLLFELSQHPKSQDRVREEIKSLREQHGEKRFLTSSEYDSLTYTNTVIKVCMHIQAGPVLIGDIGSAPLASNCPKHHAPSWQGRCYSIGRTSNYH